MEPVQPAPQLGRSPLPYITPRLQDDIDEEDEEYESDFSTGIGSEAVSQQYVALPWPATATVVSRGLSPCTSVRCGISSPMLGDQQICMSGSSLTVWSGAHVMHGGGGGAVWPQSLTLSKTERMRVSQRSGATSVGGKAVTTFSDTTPIPRTRSVVATGSVASISSSVNAAASSRCELTPENLERLGRTDAVLEGFPVAAFEVKEQAAAEVSPPVIIAVSRSRGGYASEAGGERVSRAAALLKPQSLSTRQPRRGLGSPSGSPAPLDALARANPVAGGQRDLSRRDDRRQGEHGGTTEHPPIKDCTSLLAGSHDTYRQPNGRIIKNVGREGNEHPGPTSEVGVAATKFSSLSPVAAQSPLASSCASRPTRERGSSRVPVRRQHRTSERTRYHGEILELEDCTEMKVYTASFVSPKVFSPPTPAPDGPITAGATPFGTRVPASAARGSRCTSVSAGPNVCGITEPSKGSTSVRVSQAAWRIPSPAVGAEGAALPPSCSASPGRRADEESTGVLRGASQAPLTGLVKKESQRTGAAGVDAGAQVGHGIHAATPRLDRQHGRRMPTSQQTHTAVPARASENAGDARRDDELTGLDQCKGEAGEREAADASGQPLSMMTHQGDSLAPCSGATSRPPHLSTTAVGMTSATSGGFPSATQVPIIPAAAAQTQATPRHPQQQVRPAIILSSFGATAPLPSKAPSTVAAAPTSNGTSDTHLKVIPASRLDSSRCATVVSAVSIRRSPSDTRMPSSADCLPSLGSTQPPLSLRSTNSGSRLRWALTVGSRASSAEISQGHVGKGRAKSFDSISPISVRSSQNEACPPDVTGERNSPRDSPSRLGSRGPAASSSLEGQSRARWLSSNMTADPSTDTDSTLAVASLDMAAVGRTRCEDSTGRPQEKASVSAAVALGTPSPTRAGTGGHKNAGGPSGQAAARGRRTSSQAWWLAGGNRIRITDRCVSRRGHLSCATSTPSEENGVASRVLRGQSHPLEPLSGSTRPVPPQAAGTAGNALDAARLSMKTDASGLLQGATSVAGVGTVGHIRGASQMGTLRVSVLADRRSALVGFPGAGNGASDSGVQAGDPIISPSRSRALSYSRCAGVLPSTGGIPAPPPQSPGSLTKDIVGSDQEAAGQTRQDRPRRSESDLRGTVDSAHEPPSKGVEVVCPAQSPPGVRGAIHKGSGNAAPATHRVAGGGISSGPLVQSPSLRTVGEPPGRLEKGLSGRIGRLPTPGSSQPAETVASAACWNTSNDTSIIGGSRDQVPLTAVRQGTAVPVRERAASASRTSTFSERSGNNPDGQRQREPHDHSHSITMHENTVLSHNLSQQSCVEGTHVLPKRRLPPRKVPFLRRRRRTTDVSLPNGEGSAMS